MPHRAFSLCELIIALSLLAGISCMGVLASDLSERSMAESEGARLALWLQEKFVRADAQGRFFEIVSSPAWNDKITVNWLDNVRGKLLRENDVYSSEGRALFSGSVAGLLIYNPIVNSLNPFGVTLRVRGAGETVGHVIISRFGRVRISNNLEE